MIENNKKIIKKCKDASRILKTLEKKVFEWDFYNEKQFKVVQKELKKHSSILKEMSEDWPGLITAQYIMGKTFGNYKKLKRFFNQNNKLLLEEEKQAVRFFMENPWRYSVFTVTKLLDDNFLEVSDISSGESLLIYSEGLIRLFREGKRLFLCLLLYNGKCFQTTGIINYFQGFDPVDIFTFSNKASYLYKDKSDLSRAVNHKPLLFFLLYRYAEIPTTSHDNKIIKFCFHSIKAPKFNPGNFTQIIKVRKEKNVLKCTLKGSKEPFHIKTLYYNTRDHILHVHTSGIKRYKSIQNMLGKECPLPSTPEWHCGPTMILAIEEILGLSPPPLTLNKNFVEKPAPEMDKELKKMNAMIQKMTNYSNTGKEYSLKKLAEEHNIPIETAIQLKETLDQMDEKMSIDLEGGITGYSPPPPEIRRKFNEPFTDNSLFSFNNSQKTQSLLKINWPSDKKLDKLMKYTILNTNELPSMIEDHYFIVWENFGYFILMYTFYLLQHNGHSFQKVDDYCSEVLKIFWQVLTPSQDPDILDYFYYEYSHFCYIVLFRLGLITIREKIDVDDTASGDFTLKASDFFYEWIRFQQD